MACHAEPASHCEVVGVKPQNENHNSIPPPESQDKDPDANEYAMLNVTAFEDMKFHVLNLKHFHDNTEGLLSHVNSYKPNGIVLDWCYSQDGDVANLLLTSGILLRLFNSGIESKVSLTIESM